MRKRRALATLGAQRQQAEATLLRVRQQMRQWTDERARMAGVLGNGATQLGSYARLQVLREAEQQIEAQLEELRRSVAERRAAYLEARRARETLTELKQTQQEASDAETAKREQRRLEDLVLGRWSR